LYIVALMKSTMRKVSFALIAAALLFTACKKSDNTIGKSANANVGGLGNANGSTNNGNTLLTSGRWKITAISNLVEYPSPVGTQTVDGMMTLPNCEKDNLYIFNANFTETLDQGTEKCDSTALQQKNIGTWAFTGSNSKFTSNIDTTTLVADVLTLDKTTFKIRFRTMYHQVPATSTTTYTKQ